MNTKDAYLFYDSQLQPRDRIGVTRDDILMKEFESDGIKPLTRKGDVFCWCRKDQLQEQLSK